MSKEGLEPLVTKSLGVTPTEQAAIDRIAALHPEYPISFRNKNVTEAIIALGCYIAKEFSFFESESCDNLATVLNEACSYYGVRGGFKSNPESAGGNTVEANNVEV